MKDMDKDRQKAKERVKALPFKGKVKYYWGYYKIYIIVALAILLLVGATVYQKVNAPKPDLEVMVFADAYMPDEMKGPIEEKVKELAFPREDKLVQVYLTEIPFRDTSRYDEIQGASAKLLAELELGERRIYILDQATYEYVVGDHNPLEIWDENYSVALGENAKKALGLDENTTYYYLTQNLKNRKDYNEKEDIKFLYMQPVYEGLHDMQ